MYPHFKDTVPNSKSTNIEATGAKGIPLLIYSVFILLIIILSPSSSGQEPVNKAAQANQYQVLNADGRVFLFDIQKGTTVREFDTPKRYEIVVIDNTIVIIDKISGTIKEKIKIEQKQ